MTSTVSLPQGNSILTLTHPKPALWIIELHNGEDNRTTQVLLNNALMPALDIVEREWRTQRNVTTNKDAGHGAVIIVGKKNQDKFFSNGLDFANAQKDLNFFQLTFNPMLRRLLTFPIPTIAAINGHCFAGGMMLALTCDYRVITDGSSRNVWMCMNEVNFGAPWPLSFAAILRAKVGDLRLQRKIALEGHRFTPSEALAAGLVDYTVKGKTVDILAKAEELADRVSANAQQGAWGLIKLTLYADAIKAIDKDIRLINTDMDAQAAKARL